jgi:hypothetical protein
MNENPADHLDAAAFQPSHTFSVEILPGTVLELFEDIKGEDVGKVSCIRETSPDRKIRHFSAHFRFTGRARGLVRHLGQRT